MRIVCCGLLCGTHNQPPLETNRYVKAGTQVHCMKETHEWLSGMLQAAAEGKPGLSMTRVARAPHTDGESERNEVYAERPCQSEMPAS